ncbi:CaiB/BaiF CoA transferase family protein [Paraburkholderia rhynchosiae]|uniref:Carnitine dehydratase n=1 Tax=Paraburkholderia rhynchosiae TaxID=487049 RepID=A0A2N7W7W9_9BURK|nr:CaiB/BaiF CoA-transferase family protein [Paraburkholderia rhynchosiae]PMS25484.1 carnitine dehydratase [Paraburkholderia rhynchosiae]CAB3734015.1 Succinyl-CoA--L-malate CoA-transferase beta subunit [Paraburkholderia rhynchosiae]
MSNSGRDKILPLAGVRVLELGSLIAGPYASALLAQFGAEVIKVEPPGVGDPLRKWRKLHEGTSLWWYTQSRNKKSVTLDLKAPEGREVIQRLAKEVDIVIENFRPGTLEKWGIGWQQLSELNSKLIMVRISGYGQTGPLAQRPGFAAIAECMGGLRHTSGFPDRPPVRVGVSLGDTLASLYGTIGALLAMHHLKVNGGTGQFIDVALYESVFAIMESLIPEFSVQGHVRERSGASLPGISPSNTYLCGDGNYVIIAGNGDAIFRRLMTAIGRQDLADDPALAYNDGRVKNNEALDVAISAWTREHPLDDVLRILEEAEVPSGRIYTAADILSDSHYGARSMIEEHSLPDGVPVHLPGIVPKLSATPGATKWLGPSLGEHTDEVLGKLGFSGNDIARLRTQGVV